MTLRLSILAGISCLLILAFSCARTQKQAEIEDTVPEMQDITEDASAWADSALSRMSLREKAAQLLMPAIYADTIDSNLANIKRYTLAGVGGVLLLQGDMASVIRLKDEVRSCTDTLNDIPPLFIAIDAETGLGMRLADAPKFPWNRSVSKDATEQTFFDYGSEIGRECRVLGINMILGPVVDVDRATEHKKGVMHRRSLGDDQLRVANLSVAYARGLEEQRVISVAKHFPGHGPTPTDSHKQIPVIDSGKDEIFTVDLMPFKKFADNGLSAIMVGHIWAPALDSVCRPASFSHVIITDILRNQMGFDGLVIVDAMAMGGAIGYSAVDAVAAGADIIIAPGNLEKEIEEICNAVDDGKISKDEIDRSCHRILLYKYLFVITGADEDVPSDEKTMERLRQEALPIIDSLKSR